MATHGRARGRRPQDPNLFAHKTWLGLLEDQRVGIVVSPPALVAAQVLPSTDVVPAQNALLALLTAKPKDLRQAIAENWGQTDDVVLTDLGPFCEEVLGFRPTDLLPVAADDARFSVHLPEQRETLSPTHVVMAADQPERALLLVRQEPLRSDLDSLPADKADGGGFRASPQTRFERLLRDTGVHIGILFNGAAIRLVYAPRAETPGHISFPVRAMCEVLGRPILSGLIMLLHADRLFAGPKEARLPAILEESRKYQSTVSTKLAEQVLAALKALLGGFQLASDADPRGRGKLLEDLLAEDKAHVYGGLLTTLMRLVFVLYAEDRALLPQTSLYLDGYSVTGLFEQLREDAGRYPGTMKARYGAWSRLLTLFRILHDGAKAEDLSIPARAGRLFDPDAFPFLEGRLHKALRVSDEALTVPLISDGVIYEVLSLLLYLDGERLSYRALEVEQIGSVYEAMMGFTLEEAAGRSVAVSPHQVVIDLDAVLKQPEAGRDKVLIAAECKLSDASLKAWKAAKDEAGLVAALGKKVVKRKGLDPEVWNAGALYLQPTEERRSSGSHYTPRELTEPIVRTTLKPQLDALAGGKTPAVEQILSLRVCDPAMGSGAFLVESCRFLADALNQAWEVHGGVPPIPPDEDQVLHARRLVAQRCLYGVDKNPFAVDLAKLSLWLFTLAKDHPFTFLDHALRQGDSLVGLTQEQTACFDWKNTAKPSLLLRPRLITSMKAVQQKRGEIHALGDSTDVALKAALLEEAEEAVADFRSIADLAVLAFFSEKKDAAREKKRKALADAVVEPFLSGRRTSHELAEEARELERLVPPVTPFHWELEFPEVFVRDNGGFDAFVGNPPFAGKNTLLRTGGPFYIEWLKSLHEGSHGNADLSAHFFRRAFVLLRDSGTFGLIATNTIAQGDTRGTGLRWIVQHGGAIFAAHRRYKWPGAAAVVVSVVHVKRGGMPLKSALDGREVPRISAFLVANDIDDDPAPLAENQGKGFQGSIVLGAGFTFDDTDKKRRANSLADMERLIRGNPKNAAKIFSYLGGEEFNSSPTHANHRYVINFGQMSEEEARGWPDLMTVVEAKVRGSRGSHSTAAWWHFERLRQELYEAIHGMPRVLAIARVTQYAAFSFLPTAMVYSEQLVVFAFDHANAFAVLQSRAHEAWTRFFASSMKDDLRYTPSDCFETFPFPAGWETNAAIEAAGKAYYEYRAGLMVENNEGLTKTYNRFHDPEERSAAIKKLRALHAEMDRAVLDAYGWSDVPIDCEFLLDHDDGEDNEEDEGGKKRKRKPYRYRWPDDVRDEVLARLIELNRVRAEEERRSGVVARARVGVEEEEG